MVMSAIMGALASKEILTILGIGTVTTISGLVSKYFLDRSIRGEGTDKKAYALGLAIHMLVLFALAGYFGSLFIDLLQAVETIFFM